MYAIDEEEYYQDILEDSANTVHRRVGHVTLPYRHYIIVWGGFMSDEEDTETYCSSRKIWFYNVPSDLWSKKFTQGEIPFPNSGCTGIILNDSMYIYGGVEELTIDLWRYGSELHRLDLKTLTWHTPPAVGNPPKGGDKSIGWAHDDKIYIFGGYGQNQRVHINYSFDGDPSNHLDRGWNNLLSMFDPATNRWSTPRTGGTPPRPRAAHACDISGDRVYVFGGRLFDGRTNDMYVLDLKAMHWTRMTMLAWNEASGIPDERSWHSFNFISENRGLLFGGLSRQESPCGDVWECEIDNYQATWRLKGKVPKGQTLVWHRAAVAKECQELIIVGGVTCSPYVMTEFNHVDKLHVIPYGPTPLFRLSLQQVVKSEDTIDYLRGQFYLPKILIDLIRARRRFYKELFGVDRIFLTSPS